MTYGRRATLLAALAGAPGVGLAITTLGVSSWSLPVRWTLLLAVLMVWGGFVVALHRHVMRPLHTLSNLLAGLREGDLSARARIDVEDLDHDPLAMALHETNAIADLLAQQRVGTVDATNLLHKVMAEIDVAVMAFDDRHHLRLANRAAEKLLGQPIERLRGRTSDTLGTDAWLSGPTPRLLEGMPAGGLGRWELRRASFRQRGEPFTLVVLSDLSKALGDEERQAWQRLVRVLSHEINNSLAPISSVADSLAARLRRDVDDPRRLADLRAGLELIGNRADALGRFIAAHARLARLPAPRPMPLELTSVIRRCAALEPRLEVEVQASPEVIANVDADQFEQVVINLIRNAVDAALEDSANEKPRVEMSWSVQDETLSLHVRDNGPGITEAANLFVPFYSTKADGSGIGLALCKQIVQAHGGTIELRPRTDERGTSADVRLPV